MIFHWFNASEAEKTASELADHFSARAANGPPNRSEPVREGMASLQDLLCRADTDPRIAGLNFFKKARFANSFKWRLLENGIERRTADRVTHSLLVHLSRRPAARDEPPAPGEDVARFPSESDTDLLRRGNKAFASGAYKEALRIYRRLAAGASANPEVLNSLGATLCRMSEFVEAEQHFRKALALAPDYVEANYNLGNVLRWMGILEESELCLRRALKANPTHLDARSSLGLTLVSLGRPREAKTRFEKVLKTAPGNVEALFGMALIAKASGQFSEAESLIKQVLEHRPKMAAAWAELATLRPMTSADSDWLRSVKELLDAGINRFEQADLLFAIGKYYDDVGDFDEAFPRFRAANEILKEAAIKYNRKGRDGFIDDMLRLYTKDAIAAIGEGGSESNKPVFVVGMPRSGTSLTEQILASHPSVFGAGEIDFWNTFTRTHESEVRVGLLDLSLRKKLANDYLRLLESRGDALRVIDKTTINCDYIGIILSVIPNTRFIYLERDPADTCLSCYFHQFVAGLNFCLDLSDLAHYYSGHRRLMKHWQSVLPAESLLVVPYEGLVADQEVWTRKMLGFLGLDWNDRCLSFHETQRLVTTASARQVRQKISSDSIGRSRAYKKYLGPLNALKN
jgi:tetratricopeptide (TPR) repeat protein